MSAQSPLLRSALESLTHSLEHYMRDTVVDRKFAIMHIDQAIELLLKEKVRSLRTSIYRKDGKTTIGPREAYGILKNKGCVIPEQANLELIHDERNVIWHKFSSPDEDTTRFHVENALEFIERFLFKEFAIKIDEVVPGSLLSDERLQYRSEAIKVVSLIEAAIASITLDPTSSIVGAATALEIGLRSRLESEDEDTDYRALSLGELIDTAVEKDLMTEQHREYASFVSEERNKAVHSLTKATKKMAPPVVRCSQFVLKSLGYGLNEASE